MGIGARIADARKRKGWSQGRLATAVNVGQTTVSSWERDRTEPTRDDVQRIALALDVEPAELEVGDGRSEPFAPVLGRVGADAAGTIIQSTGQDAYDTAPIPPGGTSKAAAVEVVGDSMAGIADDGSLVYFEDQRTPPTEDMIRQSVVVQIEDGRVLFKRLQRGSGPGLYTLESVVGRPVEDVRIVWAAEPTAIIPPKQARRIIRRSGEA